MRQNGVRSNVRFPYSKGKSAGKRKKQGYAAREDESLGMRTGKESTKKQSFKDRRDESYGAWGKRKAGKVNKQEFIMGVVGAALRGFGKALRKGKLRSSKTGTIKIKPGVGGLKKSREMFESLQKSAATGVEKFGRPHTTKVISEQGVKKGFPGLTKQVGDITRLKKATEKKFKVKLDDLKIPKGKK